MQVFHCPSCKAKMQVADAHAGKKVACPSCGAHVKVPVPEAPADAIEVAPSAAPVSTAPPEAPAAITTPENVPSMRKAKGQDKDDDEDDRDDDRPRHRERPVGSTGAAVGMSVGLIVLLVVGIGGCVVLIIGGVLVALLVPAISSVRAAAARTETMNNMKQIALAIHSHHDATAGLPPPRMARRIGPQIGPPVDLSWRVAMLPYIEQGPMLQRFDQNNAWDHANNQPFLNQRPRPYENKTRPEGDTTHTTFQYFTGPKALFSNPDRVMFTLATIPDGSSNTFLFAEAQTGVPWTKPADMVIGEGALPLPAEKFLAAMADGSVRPIDRKKADDRVLRMLIDPADGVPLPQDWDR